MMWCLVSQYKRNRSIREKLWFKRWTHLRIECRFERLNTQISSTVTKCGRTQKINFHKMKVKQTWVSPSQKKTQRFASRALFFSEVSASIPTKIVSTLDGKSAAPSEGNVLNQCPWEPDTSAASKDSRPHHLDPSLSPANGRGHGQGYMCVYIIYYIHTICVYIYIYGMVIFQQT